MLVSYFDELKRQLILSEQVISFKVLKELYGNNDGFIRVKCQLEGGDILEFAEYVLFTPPARISRETYNYHWQARVGKLIRRWDNAPHHPKLASFPDHYHDGKTVLESKPMALSKVLKLLASRSMTKE